MVDVSALNFSRLLASMQVRHDLARATRSTLGFLGPLLLAEWLQVPAFAAFGAIAGQNLAFFDIRGDYRMRVVILLAASLVLTAAVAAGAASGSHLAVALVVTAITAVFMGVWRHLNGDFGPTLASSSMFLLLIALEPTEFSASYVEHAALWTLGGALWGLLVQVALWPFRAQHPLRRTVAESWTAAAELFTALGSTETNLEARHQSIASGEATLRTTLDKTYLLLSAAKNRHNEDRVARLRALADQAGWLGLTVSGLATALETAANNPAVSLLPSAFQPIMTSLKNTAHTVALAVVTRRPEHLGLAEVRVRRLTHLLNAFEARATALGPEVGGIHLAEQAAQIRRTLAEVENQLKSTFDRSVERSGISMELFDLSAWRLRPIASVLNLDRRVDSALLRFTARLTVLMVLGAAIYKYWKIPHGFWLPLTVIVVLQPDYGSTRQRAAQRVGGTLLGSLAASALLWLQLPHEINFALLVVSLFFFGFFLTRNYGIAVIFITLFVVLLTELHQVVNWTFTLERLTATAAGGALALGAAWIFWPVWERKRFPSILLGALEENRNYWLATVEKLKSGQGFDESAVKAKRRAEGANAKLFSSLQRMMGDPKNQQEGISQAAVLANGNQRLARAFGNLVFQQGGNKLAWREEIKIAVELVEKVLAELIQTLQPPGGEAARLRALSLELDQAYGILNTLASDPGDRDGQYSRFSRQLAPIFTELSGMLQAGAHWIDDGISRRFEPTQNHAMPSPT